MKHLEHNRWYVEPEPQEETDSWLLTYLDMITLLLVLLVAMLALGKATSKESEAPPVPAFPTLPQLFPGQVDLPRAIVPIPMYPATPVPHAIVLADGTTAAAMANVTAPEPTGAPPALSENDVMDRSATHIDPAANEEAVAAPIEIASASATSASITQLDDAAIEPSFSTMTAPALPLSPEPAPQSVPAAASTVAVEPDMAVSTAPPSAEPTLPQPPSLDEKALSQLGEDIDIIRNKESISFRINSEILFSSGDTELSSDGLTVLQRLIPVFKSTDHLLTVEGHTDAVPVRSGPYPSNWELSGARAASVVRYMQSNGVARKRLRAIGYADTRPLTTNHTEKGRAINRRVELILEQPRPLKQQ